MFTHVIVAIIVTKNLLSRNEDGHRRALYDVIFLKKISKKKKSKREKRAKVLDTENFWEMSLSLHVFWVLSNRQGYFLTFSARDSFWLNKNGV